MKKFILVSILFATIIGLISSFRERESDKQAYPGYYKKSLDKFRASEISLLTQINLANLENKDQVQSIKTAINNSRTLLKKMDFWLRYLEPTMYKRLNGPLPVEWETEVFEKFEKPYKREGAGLTLATIYLDEDEVRKDSLASLIQGSLDAFATYAADSITGNLNSYDHFYLCNRLYLLNLSAIYSSGFECPDTSRIIPELRDMMSEVKILYHTFNESFPETAIKDEYLGLYEQAIKFVDAQPGQYTLFNHFDFIRNYVNPLFKMNQLAIKEFRVKSKSMADYSLNKNANSIFDKQLYFGQNAKGIFLRVDDDEELAEIGRVGKLLFYDPILSGNNKRSCSSCHKSTEYFSDTAMATPLAFDGKELLPRNAPSLIGTVYNHLAMMDGKHISLQDQVKDVITNPTELGSKESEVLRKVLSCPDYKKAFTRLLKLTPWETEITMEHVASAITYYYSSFGNYYSPFDKMMENNDVKEDKDAEKGFVLFMSKAQCATCHFVPQFNGVKPPYIGSEFEVLGVPEDTTYKKISKDKGRYIINPAEETLHAFRTGSLRNIMRTAPFMHNGVFKTMEQVVDFYDGGGGAGRGMRVENQTLSSDSLHLTRDEKAQLISFMKSLNEDIPQEHLPAALPMSTIKTLNARRVGGFY